MKIIWCKVPEICSMWRTEFFVILDHFLPFYPPNNLKNQNFEKMKETLGDIIILHKCTINNIHMMYGSWDMKRDGQNFLSFWTCFFALLPPTTTPKIKILKNWKKKTWRYCHLHKCTKNHDHMLYCSLDVAHNRFNWYFLFWAIFCPFTPFPNSPKKSKFWKNEKDTSRYHQFIHVHHYDQMMYSSWDIVYDGRTDGQTDGQMEKVTYKGGCHTKKIDTPSFAERIIRYSDS